jgi:hypothetical protein
MTYLAKSSADQSASRNREVLGLKNQLERALRVVPRNGTLADQAARAAQAELEIRELRKESSSNVALATVVGHYNATLNRCLIRTQNTSEEPNGETTWSITVEDAFDGKEFGVQMTQRSHLGDDPKTNRVLSCRFAEAPDGAAFRPGEGELRMQDCADHPADFDAGANKLMEGASALHWLGTNTRARKR